MSRPAVEVADIIQARGEKFRDSQRLSYQQLKAFNAIARCRTAVLGGHVDACPDCGHEAVSYNSCRNRHCPKCQAQRRLVWLDAREQELLAVRYFHVVFTLPHQLNTLVCANPALLYHLLFQTSARALLEVAADPKHLGAEIGFFSILHTWGQNLMLHPHVHCVIPAGGLSPDHRRWIHPRYRFFLPVKVLGKVFRGKFVAGLKRASRRGQLRLPGELRSLRSTREFRAFVRSLFLNAWVVYAKPAFGGPRAVVRYLGRYTHRVAISNHRLKAFDGKQVQFRWKDYARGGRQRQLTLTAEEFLRRFLQHILPKGFVRLRYFGFLANRWRARLLQLCRTLLGARRSRTALVPKPSATTWPCPRCGTAMEIRRRLSGVELASRHVFNDSS